MHCIMSCVVVRDAGSGEEDHEAFQYMYLLIMTFVVSHTLRHSFIELYVASIEITKMNQ